MVVPVGPSQFYGGSLPRPWVYEDVKYNSHRVDAPSTPCAPLLSWAKDAAWSMGGMSSKRKRTQGKIEGSLKKLRALDDDDDDEQDCNADINRDSKVLNPSPLDTALSVEEAFPSKDDDNEEYPKEASPSVRESTGYRKGKAGKRASLKKEKGSEGSDHKRVEPVTYAFAESTRRSRRLSGARRGRDMDT